MPGRCSTALQCSSQKKHGWNSCSGGGCRHSCPSRRKSFSIASKTDCTGPRFYDSSSFSRQRADSDKWEKPYSERCQWAGSGTQWIQTRRRKRNKAEFFKLRKLHKSWKMDEWRHGVFLSGSEAIWHRFFAHTALVPRSNPEADQKKISDRGQDESKTRWICHKSFEPTTGYVSPTHWCFDGPQNAERTERFCQIYFRASKSRIVVRGHSGQPIRFPSERVANTDSAVGWFVWWRTLNIEFWFRNVWNGNSKTWLTLSISSFSQHEFCRLYNCWLAQYIFCELWPAFCMIATFIRFFQAYHKPSSTLSCVWLLVINLRLNIVREAVAGIIKAVHDLRAGQPHVAARSSMIGHSTERKELTDYQKKGGKEASLTSLPSWLSVKARSTMSATQTATVARTLQLALCTCKSMTGNVCAVETVCIIAARVLLASSITNFFSKAAFDNKVSTSAPSLIFTAIKLLQNLKRSAAHIKAVLHRELLRLFMCLIIIGRTSSRIFIRSSGWWSARRLVSSRAEHASVQFSVSSALERLQETSFGATNACRSLVCT